MTVVAKTTRRNLFTEAWEVEGFPVALLAHIVYLRGNEQFHILHLKDEHFATVSFFFF